MVRDPSPSQSAGKTGKHDSVHKLRLPDHPIPGLVLPTKADVVVSASQSQLLRREAVQIQARIQQVKSKVSEYGASNHRGTITPLLRKALIDSASALQITQDEFLRLATTKEQRPNAEVFFSDLGKTYQAAI